MKKLLALVVLGSMIIHCAGRLEVLSYLNASKDQMAYALGLEVERVISVCSSKYTPLTKLIIPADDEAQSNRLTPPLEINLSIPEIPLKLIRQGSFLVNARNMRDESDYSLFFLTDIFRPPTSLL